MEISDLKSAALLLTRCYNIQNEEGLSNEILTIVHSCGSRGWKTAGIPKKDEKHTGKLVQA